MKKAGANMLRGRIFKPPEHHKLMPYQGIGGVEGITTNEDG